MTISQSFLTNVASENSLTPEQAMTYSQSIRLDWNAPSLNIWNSTKATNQFNDAVRIINASFNALDTSSYEDARQGFKRAGELLEWISNTDIEFADKSYLKIISSACYQLAHLPALSAGVLNKNISEMNNSISAAFIKTDFNLVLRLAIKYFANKTTTTASSLEDPIEVTETECIRTLGLISSIFRTGNILRVSNASEKLKDLLAFTKIAYPSSSYLFLRLANEVFKNNYKVSVWTYIPSFKETLSPIGQSALDKYLKISIYNNRPIFWKSQLQAIDRLATSESFALCTPTGSGKTLIAELAIIQSLFKKSTTTLIDDDWGLDEFLAPKPLVVYIVPSRALASEVEAKLHASFKNLGTSVLVTGLYGGNEWNVTQAWLTADQPTVVICTIEKAEAILRHLGNTFLTRLKCVILDEAHQVLFQKTENNLKKLINSDDRSLKLETFISRIICNQPNCKIIALSAVAGGSENFIAKWVTGNNDGHAISHKDRSTRQMIGSLECRNDRSSTIVLDILNGQALSVSTRESEAYIPNPFSLLPKLTGSLKYPGNYASCNALWGAIKLAVAEKKTLISISEKIYLYLKRYRTLFEDQANWKANCPQFFTLPTNDKKLDLYNSCLEATADYCGINSYEYYFLNKGIAVHHGQLPVRVRRLMTEVIKNGITPISIATSTLTEGVNLPFDVIFIPNIQRYDGQGGTEPIPVAEIRNLAGRAGRPGTSGEGMVLIPISLDPHSKVDSAAYKQQQVQIRNTKRNYANLKNKLTLQSDSSQRLPENSPLQSLLETLYSKWVILNANNSLTDFEFWLENSGPDSTVSIEVDSALDTFDQFVLSAIEETKLLSIGELSNAEIEIKLRLIWNSTYAKYASANQTFENAIFLRGKKMLSGAFGDEPKLRLLYHMGTPPKRSLKILEAIVDFENVLQIFNDYHSMAQNDKFQIIFNLLNSLVQINEFRIESSSNLEEISRWWLKIENASSPDQDEVSSWLKFSNSFFEIHINNAISIILANIWNEHNNGEFVVPNLDSWKVTMNLSWSVFWLREMLSWGTTEPLVAFLLSSGSVKTRQEATIKINDYLEWLLLNESEAIGDEIYNPKFMYRWIRSTQFLTSFDPSFTLEINSVLKRDFSLAQTSLFNVYPYEKDNELHWYDPAGYLLACSQIPTGWHNSNFEKYDFILNSTISKISGEKII